MSFRFQKLLLVSMDSSGNKLSDKHCLHKTKIWSWLAPSPAGFPGTLNETLESAAILENPWLTSDPGTCNGARKMVFQTEDSLNLSSQHLL